MAYTVSSTPSAAARTSDFVLRQIAALPDALANINQRNRELAMREKLATAQVGALEDAAATREEMQAARANLSRRVGDYLASNPNVDPLIGAALMNAAAKGSTTGVLQGNAFLRNLDERQRANADNAVFAGRIDGFTSNPFLNSIAGEFARRGNIGAAANLVAASLANSDAEKKAAEQNAAIGAAYNALGLDKVYGASMPPAAQAMLIKGYQPAAPEPKVSYGEDANGNRIAYITDAKGGVKLVPNVPAPRVFNEKLSDGRTITGVAYGNAFFPWNNKSASGSGYALPPFVYHNGKVIPRDLPKTTSITFDPKTGRFENSATGGTINPAYEAALREQFGGAETPEKQGQNTQKAINRFFK